MWVCLALSQGKYLVTVLCYQNDVLPLCAGYPWCLHRPPILPHHILIPGAHHQDWLNSKGHAWHHLRLRSQVCLMMVDHGRHVHVMRDAMPSEIFIDCIAMSISILLNDLSNLGVANAWLADVYGSPHGLSGDLRELLDVRMDVAKHHHARVVTVMPLVVADDIDVEVLSVFEELGIGHAMCHHIVDGGAHRLREMHEIYG